MNNFEIDLDLEDTLNDFMWNKDMETDENKEYIRENWDNIIESEKENLESYVNDSDTPLDTLRVIRDNQGEMTITNDDGQELGSIGYYTDIKL